MGIEAIAVLVLLVTAVGTLALTKLPTDGVLVAVLTVLLTVPLPDGQGAWTFGILTPAQGLAGFANPGLATVGVLFLVVAGLRETGGIDWIAQRVLGRPQTLRGALLRVVLPVTGCSAFLNNTPLVAMLIPALHDWSKRLSIRPSKLMIPLSYAAILGGTCSLIGTSTNLVVAGLVSAETDLPPLGLFEITWVGLPVAVIGGLFLVLAGPRLLPDRGAAGASFANVREYTLEMVVPEGSPHLGRTIEAAGLRNLPGCFLVEIERDEQLIAPVTPEQTLRAGDRLLFAGIVESIKDLQNQRGLALATNQVFKLDSPRHSRRLFEAVVSPTFPHSGRTIRESRFRTHYGAAIIAVARNGERIARKIGDIELRTGDTLLIEGDVDFGERLRNSSDFSLISALEDSTPRRHAMAPVALGILVAMVALAAFTSLGMLLAALLAAMAMLATRCCTWAEAKRQVDWSTLIVIACALALGQALEVSGLADLTAGAMFQWAGDHPWLCLVAVYAVTSLATEVISNAAAVALVFPIAVSTAQELDADPLPFIIALMMAGSASFATPLGYQTNLMVLGPGGYRFADFLRIGIPMNLLVGVAAVVLIPLIWSF
jgi:di/tricarboxylate transporter